MLGLDSDILTSETWTFTVGCDLSVKEMIERAGATCAIDEGELDACVRAYRPSESFDRVTAELFQLSSISTIQEVRRYLENSGLRNISLPELCGLGSVLPPHNSAAYLAPNTFLRGKRHFFYLDDFSGDRFLRMCSIYADIASERVWIAAIRTI